MATELVTSELSTKDENKQPTCPLKICTDLLKDLGATEKQLKALEIRLANSEDQIEKIKREHLGETVVFLKMCYNIIYTEKQLVYDLFYNY